MLAALSMAVPALAGTPVALKSAIASHGPNITLGDLFDDAGSASAVVVARAAQPGYDAVLDADTVQTAARRAGLDWDNASGFRRIAVSAMGSEAPARAPSARKTPRKGRAAQALIYARNIPAGEVLSADDLVWSDEAAAPGDGISDPDAAIGKIARHALRAGAAAASRDLASPKVIKRDDVVAVTFAADGVSLTLQAKAMGDAAAGEAVSVMNPQSKKVIEAICSGPDQAVIGPAADALRAAQASHPLQTASLR
jgi:flagella basal body P-ring formation protein FlgA